MELGIGLEKSCFGEERWRGGKGVKVCFGEWGGWVGIGRRGFCLIELVGDVCVGYR